MYVQNPCGDSARLDIWTDAITQFMYGNSPIPEV